MNAFIKSQWKTLLFFAVVGLVGGFCIGLYQLDSFPAEIQQEVLSQGFSRTMLGVVTAVQSAGYGIILGVFGILLSKKIGLWKEERSLTKKPLLAAIAVSVVGGLAMILLDVLFFGRYSEPIMASYAAKPSLVFILGAVTYGAVIEEVMLRLFMMSLITFLLHRLFGKKTEMPATWILIVANVLAALLFAAGHLPATFLLLGSSPIILFRCFLLNGGIGLLFGWLYRKYGLRYAMIAHGGCHVISKLIWIVFI